MTESPHLHVTRRERQILDVLFRRGAATASQVLEEIPDPPSSSAVRVMLRRLEDKGHVTHVQEGVRYIYKPTVTPESARKSALDRLVNTFFGGSDGLALAALFDRASGDLSEEELSQLSEMVEAAARKERTGRRRPAGRRERR